MIQLEILSGSKAGDVHVARRFPVRIGRAASCQLKLEDPGVWDEHLVLRLKRGEGFLLEAHPEARTSVNDEPVADSALLRNGDKIQIGAATLQFWLAETRQHGLRVREACVWIGIVLVTLTQIALIYYLSR